MKVTQDEKASSFEKLHIYQIARELAKEIYLISHKTPFRIDRTLCEQIRRSVISILSNIAEGFERDSNTEFIQFLYYAKGSCGELRAQLQIASDQNYLAPESYEVLREKSRMLNGMISNFISYLRKSELKGSRYKESKVSEK